MHLPTFPLVGCQLAASTEVAGISDWNTLAFYFSLVLVPLGCSNQIPQTGNLVDSRSLLLTALEAAGWRSWCQHGSVRALCVPAGHLSLCPHMADGAVELSGAFFIRAWIPRMGLHPHGLSTFQRPHPVTYHLLQGLGFQHMNLAGTF